LRIDGDKVRIAVQFAVIDDQLSDIMAGFVDGDTALLQTVVYEYCAAGGGFLG
jgi:hypothetical protein